MPQKVERVYTLSEKIQVILKKNWNFGRIPEIIWRLGKGKIRSLKFSSCKNIIRKK